MNTIKQDSLTQCVAVHYEKESINNKGNNDGFIYGIYHYNDNEIYRIEWFKTMLERDEQIKQYDFCIWI